MWVYGEYKTQYLGAVLGFCVHIVHCFHWDCTSIARIDYINWMAVRRPIFVTGLPNMISMI